MQTPLGSIEVSVFETGVPPRFRLYVYDHGGKLLPPPSARDVTLDTVRPDGTRHRFVFEDHGVYLEATELLPEPHEFEVEVMTSAAGVVPTLYAARFTEDGHDHGAGGHAHGGHDHAHDHRDHAHATGPLGWLKNTFGHSHSIVEKTDTALESNERGIRALKRSLVILALTAAFQIVIVWISGSVALLADTIHNFADATTSLPLWLAFALARRGVNRRFTYGYGKVEDVAGVMIVLIIFLSACVAAYESVVKLLHPMPITNVGWVALAAVIGFLGNEWVALYRIREGKAIGSTALVADGYHARVDGFTSLAVLIGVLGVWIGVPTLDPLVGIGITLAILFIVRDAARSVWLRLIDGIEPDILESIEHAPLHVAGVRRVRNVRARWVGHRVHTELDVDVSPELSVQQAERVAQAVTASLHDHVRLLENAVVRARPA
ncbi:cation diffusion facilitator family transporter [Deinococcus metalli]|uniref:cation diffusion facilitator family transporter n=1 Tax=Deinococcus metalli TaxID=1141878 RepID=UPI00361F6EEA